VTTILDATIAKPDRRQIDSYYAGILRDIRKLLGPDVPIEPWFMPANPKPKPGKNVSSKRLILTHPQSGYERWNDRHDRPYKAETIRREASALIETIKHQRAA
jgi:hypothetical protein